MRKKYKIINILIQSQKKRKNSFEVKIQNKKTCLVVLNFLWLNKIIYGYTLKYPKKYIVYLKHNKYGFNTLFKKIKKNLGLKNIKNLHNRNKNTFFIIRTGGSFINVKEIKLKKIGGFVFYSIF